MQLVIGNKNYSSWSLRAWLMLAANQIPFEEIRIPLSRENSGSALKKYSAAARVPVLIDEGTTIWDSLAICEYISEHYLDGGGWPADLKSRAIARSCCAEMHSGFFALREKLPMNCRAVDRKVTGNAKLSQEIDRIDQLWSELRTQYAASGPWLFGRFSIADCVYAPVVFRFSTYNVPVSTSSRDYMKTLKAHPAVQLWLQQAKAETETIEMEEVGIE